MPDYHAMPDYAARAAAGVRELQHWYVRHTGVWNTTGWWQSANALTVMTRFIQHTGDERHHRDIEHTFKHAQRAHANFINMYYDDCGWWGLAWVDAYDLTGEPRYLDAARAIFANNQGAWDGTCGGGVWWNTERTYKNAITNELFFTLAALLHQRTPGDTEYLSWAQRGWQWIVDRALIGPDHLINDGLTNACVNNNGTTWTYNQGVVLGGLAALFDITGDREYLTHGEFIADATLSRLANAQGILTEPCEPTSCNSDQSQFKGIFARHLYEFYRRSRKRQYRDFLLVNADSIWDNNRNERDQFGLRWGGPFDSADASRQSSALQVLVAAAAIAGEEQA
jgi:predicted alpha-1,6-mannanase (GH76 family)